VTGTLAPEAMRIWAAQLGPRVAAVVVTHNRKGQLRRTVERLLEEGVDHLVVVDNASTDGTRDLLERLGAGQQEGRLHVILSSRNRGGADGFERGLRAAVALYDADWYVVMDDDARPLPGTIARFRSLAAGAGGDGHAGFDALAGGVFYPDGAICETNRPSRNPFWHARSFVRTLLGAGRAGFHVSDADYAAAAPVRIDAASFVGLFLSRAAIRRAGYPQGELFIYGDDVLYTLGLSRAGGRIGFAPWLGFEHDCTTFRRGEGQIHRPLWKVYYNYRNGLFAYRAAAGPVLFWLVLAMSAPKWALKARDYDAGERRTFLRLLGLALGDGLRKRRQRPHRQILAIARHGQRNAVRSRRDVVVAPGE
jgi:GT2 family glycosyltransferase